MPLTSSATSTVPARLAARSAWPIARPSAHQDVGQRQPREPAELARDELHVVKPAPRKGRGRGRHKADGVHLAGVIAGPAVRRGPGGGLLQRAEHGGRHDRRQSKLVVVLHRGDEPPHRPQKAQRADAGARLPGLGALGAGEAAVRGATVGARQLLADPRQRGQALVAQEGPGLVAAHAARGGNQLKRLVHDG